MKTDYFISTELFHFHGKNPLVWCSSIYLSDSFPYSAPLEACRVFANLYFIFHLTFLLFLNPSRHFSQKGESLPFMTVISLTCADFFRNIYTNKNNSYCRFAKKRVVEKATRSRVCRFPIFLGNSKNFVWKICSGCDELSGCGEWVERASETGKQKI